jgi:glutamate 5-kinase
MKIVIKIGSNLLVNEEGEIEKQVIIELSREISSLIKTGNKVCLVTSGARAAGIGKFRGKMADTDLYISQALCAVGQVEIMKLIPMPFLFTGFQQPRFFLQGKISELEKDF